ncbi:cupin domain-containing protein [Uliginosibacterium sediminicola]|uniref:Cupin domain-containing protein n=1 Tax=Uliginosibacterium sediminicola TaxID=2024550 RepID=A0ABU9YYD0_9RHOO
MTPELFNLFAQLPVTGEEEHFQCLFESDLVRIERIVSDGQHSAADFWYDQPHDEWVMLLRGEAALEFAGGAQQVLRPGDSLHIPPRCQHRVAFTAPRTVWLAVHVFG